MAKRILSLAPSNTEILFALGAGDRVVGVTSFCDFPPAARSLPRVGSWISVTNIKQLDEIKPDLILTSMFVPELVQKWATKKKVELVNLYPQTIEGIYESILRVGKLVDNIQIAEKLVGVMKKRFAQIKEQSKKITNRPRVYSEEYPKPPTVAANWVPELIEIAGGTPLSKKGILSYEINSEKVAKFDPDVIVLHWCGFGMKQNVGEVALRPGWKSIRAVKENKIFIADDTFLNRPCPRIWMGAEMLQKILIENPVSKE